MLRTIWSQLENGKNYVTIWLDTDSQPGYGLALVRILGSDHALTSPEGISVIRTSSDKKTVIVAALILAGGDTLPLTIDVTSLGTEARYSGVTIEVEMADREGGSQSLVRVMLSESASSELHENELCIFPGRGPKPAPRFLTRGPPLGLGEGLGVDMFGSVASIRARDNILVVSPRDMVRSVIGPARVVLPDAPRLVRTWTYRESSEPGEDTKRAADAMQARIVTRHAQSGSALLFQAALQLDASDSALVLSALHFFVWRRQLQGWESLMDERSKSNWHSLKSAGGSVVAGVRRQLNGVEAFSLDAMEHHHDGHTLVLRHAMDDLAVGDVFGIVAPAACVPFDTRLTLPVQLQHHEQTCSLPALFVYLGNKAMPLPQLPQDLNPAPIIRALKAAVEAAVAQIEVAPAFKRERRKSLAAFYAVPPDMDAGTNDGRWPPPIDLGLKSIVLAEALRALRYAAVASSNRQTDLRPPEEATLDRMLGEGGYVEAPEVAHLLVGLAQFRLAVDRIGRVGAAPADAAPLAAFAHCIGCSDDTVSWIDQLSDGGQATLWRLLQDADWWRFDDDNGNHPRLAQLFSILQRWSIAPDRRLLNWCSTNAQVRHLADMARDVGEGIGAAIAALEAVGRHNEAATMAVAVASWSPGKPHSRLLGLEVLETLRQRIDRVTQGRHAAAAALATALDRLLHPIKRRYHDASASVGEGRDANQLRQDIAGQLTAVSQRSPELLAAARALADTLVDATRDELLMVDANVAGFLHVADALQIASLRVESDLGVSRSYVSALAGDATKALGGSRPRDLAEGLAIDLEAAHALVDRSCWNAAAMVGPAKLHFDDVVLSAIQFRPQEIERLALSHTLAPLELQLTQATETLTKPGVASVLPVDVKLAIEAIIAAEQRGSAGLPQRASAITLLALHLGLGDERP